MMISVEQIGVQELTPQEQREVFGGGLLRTIGYWAGRLVGGLVDNITDAIDARINLYETIVNWESGIVER